MATERIPTPADADPARRPLVITATGQCVKLLEVTDYGVSVVSYPNGRIGQLATDTLCLVELDG